MRYVSGLPASLLVLFGTSLVPAVAQTNSTIAADKITVELTIALDPLGSTVFNDWLLGVGSGTYTPAGSIANGSGTVEIKVKNDGSVSVKKLEATFDLTYCASPLGADSDNCTTFATLRGVDANFDNTMATSYSPPAPLIGMRVVSAATGTIKFPGLHKVALQPGTFIYSGPPPTSGVPTAFFLTFGFNSTQLGAVDYSLALNGSLPGK